MLELTKTLKLNNSIFFIFEEVPRRQRQSPVAALLCKSEVGRLLHGNLNVKQDNLLLVVALLSSFCLPSFLTVSDTPVLLLNNN